VFTGAVYPAAGRRQSSGAAVTAPLLQHTSIETEIVEMKQGNVSHSINNGWNSTSTPPLYRVHNSPPFVSFLSQISPIHIVRKNFFEVAYLTL
jgi:hypothetical protein